MKTSLVNILILLLAIPFFSCSSDKESSTSEPPMVDSPISDQVLTQDSQSYVIDLIDNFSDDETLLLDFSVENTDEDVVTVGVTNSDLSITVVGQGTATITVTATDEHGNSVSDSFTVYVTETVAICDGQLDISTTPGNCVSQPDTDNTYEESIAQDIRTITTNGIPNHAYTNVNPTASELNSDTKVFTIDATPAMAATTSSIIRPNYRPLRKFGVTMIGVTIDPAPAQPFIFEDSNGEYNWDWVMEPTNNTNVVRLDCAMAHVQPDGTYHYHGDMVEYVNTIQNGLGDGTVVPNEPVQVGWAADGYPIIYKYGPDENGTLALLEPGYQLKQGTRPGDGESAPCGAYNGTYTNDYEHVAGVGDLDTCNGVQRNITLNGQTFDYFYVITDAFPVIPRCLVGTPDDSFNLGM